jgi:hypothetical protein
VDALLADGTPLGWIIAIVIAGVIIGAVIIGWLHERLAHALELRVKHRNGRSLGEAGVVRRDFSRSQRTQMVRRLSGFERSA